MVAFERVVLTSLTNIRVTISDIDRKISQMTAARGLRVDLPVELPLRSTDEFDTLDDWCRTDSNKTNLVSNMIFLLFSYHVNIHP